MAVRFTHPITSGMCIITTRGNHERIGGFDEAVAFGEDIDYGLRSFRSGAKYRIFFDVRVRASARRLDKYGRWQVGMTWLKWHRETARHGAIRDGTKYDYEFGYWKSRS